jgi:hypothetical protein
MKSAVVSMALQEVAGADVSYPWSSLVPQLVLLCDLGGILVLWDILRDGMVGMRLLGVCFSAHFDCCCF